MPLFVLRCHLLIRFCLSFVLFFRLLCSCKFVTTTPDKFQLHRQVRVSQINVRVPIRLKFKLYAFFIEWGIMMNFLCLGRQYIVNYCEFPSKFSRNCQKRFAPKIARHDYWENNTKMSHCDRQICFPDFVGWTLVAVPLVLPLPNCFLRVCLTLTLFAPLKFLLPLTTSSISKKF